VSPSNPGLVYERFPLILAAPSGAGKTSIARELGKRRPDIEFSTSCTTRPPRPGERDGVDYHFRSEAEFRGMVAAGDLLEWAEVHGHLYGTPRSNLVEARHRRHLLLLDIDVQGSRQVKRSVPESVSVFVLPPSADELVRRLTARGSEDAEVRHRRLAAARDELKAAGEFDYVVVNDDLSTAVDAVEGILLAEAGRVSRISGLDKHIAGLVDGLGTSLGVR
jgi:guanylate kinase